MWCHQHFACQAGVNLYGQAESVICLRRGSKMFAAKYPGGPVSGREPPPAGRRLLTDPQMSWVDGCLSIFCCSVPGTYSITRYGMLSSTS